MDRELEEDERLTPVTRRTRSWVDDVNSTFTGSEASSVGIVLWRLSSLDGTQYKVPTLNSWRFQRLTASSASSFLVSCLFNLVFRLFIHFLIFKFVFFFRSVLVFSIPFHIFSFPYYHRSMIL